MLPQFALIVDYQRCGVSILEVVIAICCGKIVAFFEIDFNLLIAETESLIYFEIIFLNIKVKFYSHLILLQSFESYNN